MKLKIKSTEEVEIICYSVQDGKEHRAIVNADSYGRLSFRMVSK